MSESITWWTGFDLPGKKEELQRLEAQTQVEHFWENHEHATKVSQDISELKEEIEMLEAVQKEWADIQALSALGEQDEEGITAFEKRISREEFRIFLSGKYDAHSALLEVFSGAGGQDAQDWATMLLRMYERYCQQKGYKTILLQQTFGEVGAEGRIGTKSATLEVRGKYAYGFLKKESGVHRLVRMSPFSAQQLRHTSFALVNVLPEIEEKSSHIDIKPEELRIDTFRASGPGGQYVNKTESAVRITHIPTGLVVACQSERLQGKNRETAMKILQAKLVHMQEEHHKKELQDIKGEQVSASWGNQIRSYVLHPYRMIKDLRTQYETSDVEGVLDGDLEPFIQAELKL